jgi:O-antigen/teichoic acid export membrane protein
MKAQLASFPFLLKRRLGSNWVLYTNASSLIATTAVTSGLGFVYWWLAARLFPQQSVGLASAAVSAMMLLGALGMLGLGTLVITEIGRDPSTAGSITITSILVVGSASLILGILFAIAAPVLTSELAPLSSSVGEIILFAAGVVFTAITLLVDQVMIALLRGGLQLSRNILFAVVKLALLYVIALWAAEKSGMNIYLAWLLGNVISLAIITLFLMWKRIRVIYRPRFGFIRHLGGPALAHHATNLILQAPSLIMPIAVTTLVSATANANFYAAWMIASFVFVLPAHLTTVLHAVGAQSPQSVKSRLRSTMRFSFLVALPISGILFLGAGIILSIFGKQYVEQAEWTLRFLSLGVFPLIIKYHYVALLRVYSQVQNAFPVLVFGSVLEISFAVVGLELGALTGLSVGWFLAVCLEAVVMYVKLQQMISSQKFTPEAST